MAQKKDSDAMTEATKYEFVQMGGNAVQTRVPTADEADALHILTQRAEEAASGGPPHTTTTPPLTGVFVKIRRALGGGF